nr:hypothetical protein CFP56_02767 [Quercus suber]
MNQAEPDAERLRKQTSPPKSMYCDRMTYKLGSGVEHVVYLAKGTQQAACKHIIDKNWDALAQFPAWTGAPDQQYKESDYFYTTEEEEEKLNGAQHEPSGS